MDLEDILMYGAVSVGVSLLTAHFWKKAQAKRRLARRTAGPAFPTTEYRSSHYQRRGSVPMPGSSNYVPPVASPASYRL